jgi:hypothetical protein
VINELKPAARIASCNTFKPCHSIMIIVLKKETEMFFGPVEPYSFPY